MSDEEEFSLMDILFDNPLTVMSGGLFLVFYGFVIVSTLVILAVTKSQIDKSDRLNLPPIPPNIDPYEIAYLRGGTNEMARAVIFSLMQKGFIECNIQDKTSEIVRLNPNTSVSGLPQIEQLALGWIGTRREAKEVFDSNYGLVGQLSSYGQTYQARLENAQMLTGDDTRQTIKPLKWAAYLVIFALGGYKIFASLATGEGGIVLPVIFLIIGILIVRSIAKFPRLTKLGKTYLQRLQLAFENLKLEAQAPYIPNGHFQGAPRTAFAGVDPLLLSVGVFGSAILAGTIYDSYNQAFRRTQNQTGSSCGGGSGCGSGGCGSCSTGSSDGGSGCSSGCGGGCGGGGD